MKLSNIKYLFVAMLLIGFVSCDEDDDNVIIIDDGEVMNDDDGGMMPPEPLDFSGTFVQEDQMGRPGINTVLSGTEQIKNDFNVTIPSEQGAIFQPLFLDQAVALHAAFGVEYETNILGQDATTLTTVLATDVLQVAPDGPTSYFAGTPTAPDLTGLLTGRGLQDDVIDVSLILLFGGMEGDRFNGQDVDGDGVADLPILVSDGVDASGETPSDSFPYLEAPHN